MLQTSPASRLMFTVGRSLLALYFLVPGLMKFAAFPAHVAMMSAHNIPNPAPLLVVAGVAQVAGALLLLADRFVRFSAMGFVLYVLVINVLLHDFWNFTGLQAAHETQNFIKNLGILAGLLVLAGVSPWRAPGVRGLLASDTKALAP